MDDFMTKVFEEYEKIYGKGAKMEDGETQVFELQDCTIVVSLRYGDMSVQILGDKPIKCDFASGMLKDSESEE